ncbi:HesB/IscA family protein [Glaciecola siphonariae]|uniref:HesB/IscA family protein n=1 Tax=Glaciecola siphonariae TaxID=521012 RepID=A0ABV9LSN9_9ALTE
MTVETFIPEKQTITLTDSAIRHFESKQKAQPEKLIRFSTKVSGCTGYAYVLDLVDAPQDTDEVIQFTDSLRIAVASHAQELLKNTEIDYVKEGVNGVIKYNNPNVVNECGCGESFNVG